MLIKPSVLIDYCCVSGQSAVFDMQMSALLRASARYYHVYIMTAAGREEVYLHVFPISYNTHITANSDSL